MHSADSSQVATNTCAWGSQSEELASARISSLVLHGMLFHLYVAIHSSSHHATSSPIDGIIWEQTMTFWGIIYHCPHRINLTKSSTTSDMYNFYRNGYCTMYF